MILSDIKFEGIDMIGAKVYVKVAGENLELNNCVRNGYNVLTQLEPIRFNEQNSTYDFKSKGEPMTFDIAEGPFYHSGFGETAYLMYDSSGCRRVYPLSRLIKIQNNALQESFA